MRGPHQEMRPPQATPTAACRASWRPVTRSLCAAMRSLHRGGGKRGVSGELIARIRALTDVAMGPV
jgi:hypothetical protein